MVKCTFLEDYVTNLGCIDFKPNWRSQRWFIQQHSIALRTTSSSYLTNMSLLEVSHKQLNQVRWTSSPFPWPTKGSTWVLKAENDQHVIRSKMVLIRQQPLVFLSCFPCRRIMEGQSRLWEKCSGVQSLNPLPSNSPTSSQLHKKMFCQEEKRPDTTSINLTPPPPSFKPNTSLLQH